MCIPLQVIGSSELIVSCNSESCIVVCDDCQVVVIDQRIINQGTVLEKLVLFHIDLNMTL